MWTADKIIYNGIDTYIKAYQGSSLIWEKNIITPEDPADDITLPYVTFRAEEAGSTLGLSNLSTIQTLEYSTDKSTWNTLDTSSTVTLSNVGDEVYVRGKLTDNLNSDNNYTQFVMTGKIAAYGNCNALWDYEDLLVLLKPYCGYALFAYCSSLTKAPKLPAMQLRNNCYAYMFYECKSLIEAPELPATNIYSSGDYGCYQSMFSGCTSLTKAPSILPINSVPQHMYNSMFEGCSSLTKAPELPATTLDNGCYAWMFYYCTSLVNAPELPATELALDCYKSMFEGCESLVTTPILPAITLANTCYVNMFKGCKLVTELICLAVNSFMRQNVSGWLSGVSSTGTFYKNVEEPNLNLLPQTEFGIPSGWTILDYTA